MRCTSIRLNCDYFFTEATQRAQQKNETKRSREVSCRHNQRLAWIVASRRYPTYAMHVIHLDCATNNDYKAFHTKQDVWSRMLSWLSHSRRIVAAHTRVFESWPPSVVSNTEQLAIVISADIGDGNAVEKKKRQKRNLILLVVYLRATDSILQ